MDTVTGVLLVNLGTPKSPKPIDVYRYLIEFLTDPRVMDIPWLKRQLLVRGVIVPARFRQSAKSYQVIWTAEGSPLLVYGKKVKEKLQQTLGKDYIVELAMRYQEPSLSGAIASLMERGVGRLIVLPLFPQYASATTGSVHQRVLEEISRYQVIPHLKLISQFATDIHVIQAFCSTAAGFVLSDYDHVLFSFHGLPERHLRQLSSKCLCDVKCCTQVKKENKNCYSAQCYATASKIAEGLGLDSARYSISFQSRLGKDPWLQPYTSEVIANLAKQGKKRVLVFCPSFVCDCLETIHEIGVEYNHEFMKLGGEKLELVPGLNDHPDWIFALKQLIIKF